MLRYPQAGSKKRGMAGTGLSARMRGRRMRAVRGTIMLDSGRMGGRGKREDWEDRVVDGSMDL